MGRMLDLVGQRFGHLTVISDSGRRSSGNVCWHCRCDCGNEVDVRTAALRGGITVSCGCVRKSHSRDNLSTKSITDKLLLVNKTNGSRIRHNKPSKNSKSGVRGVVQVRKNGRLLHAWIAYIYYKGKYYYLGMYPAIELAAEARAIADAARLKDFEAWYVEHYPDKSAK